MMARLTWVPFGLLLVILPFPGTVAARLLLLLIIVLIAAGWRWRAVAGPQPALPCKPVLGLWAIVCFVSLAYAIDPLYSLGEIKNELGYTMMAFFAFFMLGQRLSETRFVLRLACAGLCLMTVWGTATWAGNDYAWYEGGRHGGSGAIASFAVTFVPVLLWMSLNETTQKARRTVLAYFVLLLWLAAITGQRAIWPALAMETLVALIALKRTGRVDMPWPRLALAIGAVMTMAVTGLLLINQHRQGGDYGMDTRMAFWPSVIDVIATHPWAGSGFGMHSFKKAYPDLIPAYNTQLWHAHNVFLNHGIWMGWPGVAALAAVFLGFGRFFGRHINSPAGIAGLSLVVGVVVRNQFNDFFVRDLSLLFWALCGLFAGICLARRGAS